MPNLFVAPRAKLDIDSALEWSTEHFGEEARQRYETLLLQSMRDVASDPLRAGVHAPHGISKQTRVYRIANSRNRAASGADRVMKPRHLLVFRVRDDNIVEIGRILHERMSLNRHLPKGWRR